MPILRCMGSKFCVKFQRATFEISHKIFEPIHHKIWILLLYLPVNYDIFELGRHKASWDGSLDRLMTTVVRSGEDITIAPFVIFFIRDISDFAKIGYIESRLYFAGTRQIRCGNTCQIWSWYSIVKQYFIILKYEMEKLRKRCNGLSKPRHRGEWYSCYSWRALSLQRYFSYGCHWTDAHDKPDTILSPWHTVYKSTGVHVCKYMLCLCIERSNTSTCHFCFYMSILYTSTVFIHLWAAYKTDI